MNMNHQVFWFTTSTGFRVAMSCSQPERGIFATHHCPYQCLTVCNVSYFPKGKKWQHKFCVSRCISGIMLVFLFFVSSGIKTHATGNLMQQACWEPGNLQLTISFISWFHFRIFSALCFLPNILKTTELYVLTCKKTQIQHIPQIRANLFLLSIA